MKIGWERICKGGIWNDSINLFVRQFYEGVRTYDHSFKIYQSLLPTLRGWVGKFV